MKVVLDANQFVSGVLRPKSTSGQILDAWQRGYFDLLLSPQILGEISRVLRYPKLQKDHQMTGEEIDEFVSCLTEFAIVTSGDLETQIVEKDPADDKYLACALEGGADFIVSGDRHLLDLKEYRAIRIVTATDFYKMISKKDPRPTFPLFGSQGLVHTSFEVGIKSSTMNDLW